MTTEFKHGDPVIDSKSGETYQFVALAVDDPTRAVTWHDVRGTYAETDLTNLRAGPKTVFVNIFWDDGINHYVAGVSETLEDSQKGREHISHNLRVVLASHEVALP